MTQISLLRYTVTIFEMTINPPKFNFIVNFNPLKITNIFVFSSCGPQDKGSLINAELIFEHLINMSVILKDARTHFLHSGLYLSAPLKLLKQDSDYSILAACSSKCQANLRHICWAHTLITGEQPTMQ